MGLDRARVLIMSENMPVPPDRRVLSEATSLARAGATVSVVCQQGPGQPLRETDANGVRFFRYRRPPQGEGLFGYALEYGVSMLQALRLMLRVWASPGFDIVQGCNPPDLYFALGLLARAFGKAYVFDQHDLSPEVYASRFGEARPAVLRTLYWLERWSYRSANAVLVTNESYRAVALRRGEIDPATVFTVRNAPRQGWPPKVQPRLDLKRGRHYLVLYVGVMAPQDGVGDLLAAARDLLAERHDVLFAFVGDGDERPALEDQAREMGIAEAVHFTGWISDDTTMAAYLATADVCVSPEPSNPLNDLSSFVKVIEYLCAERPIVAYDLPETRVTAGEAALYAPAGDHNALAGAISRVLDDEVLAQRMRRAGQERLPELLWERQERTLCEAYEFALGSPARVSASQPSQSLARDTEEAEAAD